MIREIVHDPIFLARPSSPATQEDISVADDLLETLQANREQCVGMAANMIGVSKRIIVFQDGNRYREMFNPAILVWKEPFDVEEGCLSLPGIRKTTRYRTIKVRWQTRQFQTRIQTFTGWTAQIIQHELDHCNGVLI